MGIGNEIPNVPTVNVQNVNQVSDPQADKQLEELIVQLKKKVK